MSWYGNKHNQSIKALEWLATVEGETDRRFQTCRLAAGGKYIDHLPVDGYDPKKWNGLPISRMVSTTHSTNKPLHKHSAFSFWHGCEKHFPSGNKINTVRIMTFSDIRDETKRNDAYILKHSEVRKLVIMYECQ